MPTEMTRLTRAWLFTPATRPERFAKVSEIGADVLIIDLKDAVAPADKASACNTALDWLVASREHHSAVGHALRINSLDTAAGIADLNALLVHDAAPEYLVLPKTESAGHIEIVDRLLTAAGRTARIVGIIESARGIGAVEPIAAASGRLAGLMLGAADMAADLSCATAWEPLASVRSQIVAACARVGIAAIDSPFFDIADREGCAPSPGA